MGFKFSVSDMAAKEYIRNDNMNKRKTNPNKEKGKAMRIWGGGEDKKCSVRKGFLNNFCTRSMLLMEHSGKAWGIRSENAFTFIYKISTFVPS